MDTVVEENCKRFMKLEERYNSGKLTAEEVRDEIFKSDVFFNKLDFDYKRFDIHLEKHITFKEIVLEMKQKRIELLEQMERMKKRKVFHVERNMRKSIIEEIERQRKQTTDDGSSTVENYRLHSQCICFYKI